MLKIREGGWFPIVVALVVFSMMGTWWRGRRIMAELRARDAMPLEQFVDDAEPRAAGAGAGHRDLYDPRPDAGARSRCCTR